MNLYMVMAIPAVVAVMGGVLAVIWSPSRQARSLIQHFAAGVVLAALAVEVLPELGREHAASGVLIVSFTAGGLFMYAMKLWSMRLESAAVLKGDNGFNHGLVMATLIDVMIDGLLIGTGFAASSETGLVLALGLSVELLFLGLSLLSDVIKGWRVVLMSSVLGALMFFSALSGHAVLVGASPQLISAILAFGVAVLLYLVTDELLVEAHEVEEKPSSTLWLFGGFLAFWSIQLLSR